MILLDTHVLLWFADDSHSLGRRTTRLADAALRRNELLVAAISFWELGMLVAKRRLRLDVSVSELRRQLLGDGMIAAQAAELVGLRGDPADRIAMVVTADTTILRWRGPGRRHDARL